MPRINRVRLINYGWASRRIDDLTLDFHGGMNAEIRLGNGGGKSVLQRLIYQAVHPNTTVSGNRIEDYLKNKPAMTVIEWLQDGNDSTPEFFTTGVLLSRSEARDDSNSVVHFFTFISNDRNHLSLDKLPNVSSEEGIVEIEAYTVSQTKYRNLGNNYPEIFYFSQEDRKKYQQKLEEFGISVNNWKEMILPMISTEDPFSAFLKESRTTEQLINGYLLRNIEKHLSRNRDNKAALRTQLSECVETMALQKETRDLRDALARYMEEHIPQDEMLEHILAKKKSMNACASELAGFENSLKERKKDLLAVRQDCEERELELEAELREIEKEEVSLAVHTAGETKEAAEEVLSEANRRREETAAGLNETRRDIERLRAARAMEELRKMHGRILGLEETYRGLSTSEDHRRLSRISGTLFQRCEDELAALQVKDEALRAEQEKIRNERTGLQNRQKETRTKIGALSEKTGRLDEKRKQAETKEAALMKSLRLGTLRRDFFSRLIPAETEMIKKTLAKRAEDGEKEISALQKSIRDMEEKNVRLQKETDALLVAKTKDEGTLAEEKRKLREFEAKRDALALNMERYGISLSMLYEKDYLRKECAALGESVRKDRDRISYEMQIRHELLISAKKGNVYIPDSVISMLENSGIQFQTGENFLGELGAGERNKYLRRNPTLPFSLLVNAENREKLRQLDLSSALIRQIIPVVAYADLDQKNEDSRYLVQVKPELLEKKKKKEYLSSVEQKIQEDQDRLNACEKEAERIRSFAECANNFAYAPGYEEEQKAKISALEESVQRAKEKIGANRQALEDNSRVIAETNRRLSEAKQLLKTRKEEMVRFEDYLEKDEPEYLRILDELAGAKRQKTSLEEEEKKADARLLDLEKEQKDSETRRNQVRVRITEVSGKKEKYIRSDSPDLLAESTEELEAEFAALSDSTSRESGDLLREIQDTKSREQEKIREFETYGIPEEELVGITWSSDEADRLRKLQTEKEAAAKAAEKEHNDATRKAAAAETRYETAIAEMKKLGLEAPVEPELIQMNFQERRKENRRKKIETAQEKQLADKNLRDADSVLAELSALRVIPETEEIPSLPLSEEISGQYSLLRKQYDDAGDILKEEIRAYLEEYRKLRNRYIQKNQLFEKVYKDSPPFEGMNLPAYREAESWKETCTLRMEMLQKKLDLYNTDLETLENSLSQLVLSVTGYTRRVAEALREISKQSAMKIADRSSPVRLLRIDLHEDLPDSAERLGKYLREGIRRLADLYEQKSQDLEKEKDTLLNSRRLIGVYLDQMTVIPVRVYRFDENSSHSGLVDWEKATRSNSSGEHSTSCFVIIAAMMAYTRGDDSEMNDLRTRRYEPIICDNPFASISSEYLVKPLITIVDHLHLQLICFTHSTQQSIANSFDVVIQLRNTGLVSGKSRIDVDTERVLEEKMEQASLFSGAKQLSMF